MVFLRGHEPCLFRSKKFIQQREPYQELALKYLRTKKPVSKPTGFNKIYHPFIADLISIAIPQIVFHLLLKEHPA